MIISASSFILTDSLSVHRLLKTFCSWHHQQNITKKFGNKDGTEQLSANWMFNVLSNCKTHRAIQMKGNEYYQHMKKKEADYLLKLPDNVQYPAARCAMDRNVCMYGASSSSGVESMNRANKNGVRNSTAVDPLNAGMRLIRLEAIRFEKYKKLAWAHELPLTPKGMEVMEAAFADVVPSKYTRDVQEMDTYYHCTVCRTAGGGVLYTVTIPKQPQLGSWFGTCNCGVPKRDGIPCNHMAVLADAGDIPNPDFTRLSVMPYWFRTEHWRRQYPRHVTCNGTVNLRLVMSKYDPEGDIQYCPEWLAPNKAGRPKKNARKLGPTDHIASSAKKRKTKRFCSICHKFNHNTVDCYLNLMNVRMQDNVPEEEDNANVDGEAGGI